MKLTSLSKLIRIASAGVVSKFLYLYDVNDPVDKVYEFIDRLQERLLQKDFRSYHYSMIELRIRTFSFLRDSIEVEFINVGAIDAVCSFLKSLGVVVNYGQSLGNTLSIVISSLEKLFPDWKETFRKRQPESIAISNLSKYLDNFDCYMVTRPGKVEIYSDSAYVIHDLLLEKFHIKGELGENVLILPL